MQTRTVRRILISILAVTLVLGLVALINQPPRVTVTILNPKFRMLTAKILHGKTHELAKASWPITQLSKLLHFAGLNIIVPAQLPPTPESSYAFVARFTGDFAPNELSGVKVELVDASGGVTRLRSLAGYNSQRTQSEYGGIWLLDSPPTNAVTLRLRSETAQAPLAEIRIEGR